VIVTVVHPGPPERIDTDDPASRPRLLELYRPPRPEWLRLNLVISVSGSAAGADGTSGSLTSRTDRRILGVIRELADVVLVGAASVRAEGYQVPRRSPLAVLTESGDLGGHGIEPDQLPRVIVLCPASALERVRESLGEVRTIVLAEGGDVAAAIGALRSAGLASIVCEGGPGVAAQLAASRLIDELCVTTSPLVNGAALAPLGREELPPIEVDLGQLAIDEQGYLFARWITRAS
jgi:riboflavin biosynthesis pyrimidine reductase